jgi:hypothetical protein
VKGNFLIVFYNNFDREKIKMDLNTNKYYVALRRYFGKCAANTNIEDLKAVAKSAEEKIDLALLFGNFSQNGSNVTKNLVEAKKAIGSIGKSLGKVQDICTDVVAVTKIYDGIAALSDKDANIIYHDSQKAAEAFDMMFQGFGRLCRHLPQPAKAWGKFLEEFNLFSNYNKTIQIHFGRQRELLRQIDSQFAPK